MGVPHMMHAVRVGWLSWKQMEHGHSSSPRSTKLIIYTHTYGRL